MKQDFKTIPSQFILPNEFDETSADIFVVKRYLQLVLETGQGEALIVRKVRTHERRDQYYQSLSPQYKTKIIKKEFKEVFVIDYDYIDDVTAQEIFLKQAAETSIFNKSSIEDAVKQVKKSKTESEIRKRLGMSTEDLLPIKDTYKIEEIEVTEKQLAGLNLEINFDNESLCLQCPNCGHKI